MARIRINDRYQNVIKAVMNGEDIKQFPLLSRVEVSNADVLQTFDVNEGKAQNFKNQILGDGKKYEGEIEFLNNGDITESAIQQAVNRITRDIYTALEGDLVTEALKHKGRYQQGYNDLVLTSNNDLVPRSVPVFEVPYFDKEEATAAEILINPDTGLIVGNVVPQFEIVMELSTNKVKVYGFIQVLYTFSGTGVVKVLKQKGGV